MSRLAICSTETGGPTNSKHWLITDIVEIRFANKETTRIRLFAESFGRKMFNGRRQDQADTGFAAPELWASDLSRSGTFPHGFQLTLADAVLARLSGLHVMGIIQGYDETVVIRCQNQSIRKKIF